MRSGVCGDIDMGLVPKDRLLELREKVERQRNTVAALKRDGHEHADAERQLKQMLWDLWMTENPHRGVGYPRHPGAPARQPEG